MLFDHSLLVIILEASRSTHAAWYFSGTKNEKCSKLPNGPAMPQVVWPTNDHVGTLHAEVSRMDDLQRCVGHAASAAFQIRPSRQSYLSYCAPSCATFSWKVVLL